MTAESSVGGMQGILRNRAVRLGLVAAGAVALVVLGVFLSTAMSSNESGPPPGVGTLWVGTSICSKPGRDICIKDRSEQFRWGAARVFTATILDVGPVDEVLTRPSVRGQIVIYRRSVSVGAPTGGTLSYAGPLLIKSQALGAGLYTLTFGDAMGTFTVTK